MNDDRSLRYQQRLTNFNKAFLQLEKAVLRANELDDLAKEGLIQRFEYTFELSWKTLKDYLTAQGEMTTSPREVLKKAFQYGLVDNGELWITMLDKRNLMAHTYNEAYFNEVFTAIVDQYFDQISKLIERLNHE